MYSLVKYSLDDVRMGLLPEFVPEEALWLFKRRPEKVSVEVHIRPDPACATKKRVANF